MCITCKLAHLCAALVEHRLGALPRHGIEGTPHCSSLPKVGRGMVPKQLTIFLAYLDAYFPLLPKSATAPITVHLLLFVQVLPAGNDERDELHALQRRGAQLVQRPGSLGSTAQETRPSC